VETLWVMKACQHADVYFNVRLSTSHIKYNISIVCCMLILVDAVICTITNCIPSKTHWYWKCIWVLISVLLSFQLISSVNPKLLKLTKFDDQIEACFRKYFPTMQVEVITESDLKSEENKPVKIDYKSNQYYWYTSTVCIYADFNFFTKVWRAFCDELKEIEEYSFGTLLRLDSRSDFSEHNTILVSRVQFLAIEIVRNRSGFNNSFWEARSAAKKVAEEEAKAWGTTSASPLSYTLTYSISYFYKIRLWTSVIIKYKILGFVKVNSQRQHPWFFISSPKTCLCSSTYLPRYIFTYGYYVQWLSPSKSELLVCLS